MRSNSTGFSDSFWDSYYQDLIELFGVDEIKFTHHVDDIGAIVQNGNKYFRITAYWRFEEARYHASEFIEMDELYVKEKLFDDFLRVMPFWYDLKDTKRSQPLRNLIEQSKQLQVV